MNNLIATIDQITALLEDLDGNGIIFTDEEVVRAALEELGYEN